MPTLQALADLNGQISRGDAGRGAARSPGRAAGCLAAEIEISVYRQDNGTVGVYTRSGQALLDHAPRQLDYEPGRRLSGRPPSFGAIRVVSRRRDRCRHRRAAWPALAGAVLVSGGVRAELTPELLADATADVTQRIVSPFAGRAAAGAAGGTRPGPARPRRPAGRARRSSPASRSTPRTTPPSPYPPAGNSRWHPHRHGRASPAPPAAAPPTSP